MKWSYVYLMIAVSCEVTATMALKFSDGFTRLWPTLISMTGYTLSLYFLSIAMRTLPVGIIYALWSGLGIILIVGAARFFYQQTLDMPALLGLGLIVAGIIIINLFSKSLPH
jgi:small multidrug resistance pump